VTALFVCFCLKEPASLFAKKSGLVLLMNLAASVGIEVSACRKIPEASSSANHQSNTSVSISYHFLFFQRIELLASN
jgi:hypothetical protein